MELCSISWSTFAFSLKRLDTARLIRLQPPPIVCHWYEKQIQLAVLSESSSCERGWKRRTAPMPLLSLVESFDTDASTSAAFQRVTLARPKGQRPAQWRLLAERGASNRERLGGVGGRDTFGACPG